jgi:hypothetical protein
VIPVPGEVIVIAPVPDAEIVRGRSHDYRNRLRRQRTEHFETVSEIEKERPTFGVYLGMRLWKPGRLPRKGHPGIVTANRELSAVN